MDDSNQLNFNKKNYHIHNTSYPVIYDKNGNHVHLWVKNVAGISQKAARHVVRIRLVCLLCGAALVLSTGFYT